MSYIDKEIGARETMIYESGISWWVMAPYIVAFVALLMLSVPAFVYLPAPGGVIYLLIGLVLCIMISAKALIEKITTEIAVTDQRVISKRGWLNTRVISTPLSKVNNINVYQSFLGNMFNFGNIEITTATTEETDNHILRSLTNPDTFRNTLAEEIDKQEQSAKPGFK